MEICHRLNEENSVFIYIYLKTMFKGVSFINHYLSNNYIIGGLGPRYNNTIMETKPPEYLTAMFSTYFSYVIGLFIKLSMV